MPKRRRQTKIPTPAWEPHRGVIGTRLLGRSPQFYGTVFISLIVVVALGIVGYAFLNDYIQDQRRPSSTALKVDDTRFRLDYYSDRLKIYVDQFGGQNSQAAEPVAAFPAVSDLIIREEIARRFASEFEIEASDDEIREAIGTRLALEPDSDTFEVAFQQELTRTGLTEDEYKQMVEATVLQTKLNDHFVAETPGTAESVRYRQILLATDEKAQELRTELEAGGDFVALAAGNSLDPVTKDSGGEVGWVPTGSLDASTEELIFAMEVGDLITIPTSSGVILVEMEEKAEAHEIDEAQKSVLAARTFQGWLDEKRQSLAIVNEMDLTDGDAKKIAWALDRVYQS